MSSKRAKTITLDFQTPGFVAKYMVSLVPPGVRRILELTPGAGGIVSLLEQAGYEVTAPADFFQLPKERFDAVVMNPPFNAKYAYGVPERLSNTGLRLGYEIMIQCMQMSDAVIALMPWFTISDSDTRLRTLKKFGLRSITALPRRTFAYSRIQTCVFALEKGFKGITAFHALDMIGHKPHPDIFELDGNPEPWLTKIQQDSTKLIELPPGITNGWDHSLNKQIKP